MYFPPIGDYWAPQLEPIVPEPWVDFVQAFYAAGEAKAGGASSDRP